MKLERKFEIIFGICMTALLSIAIYASVTPYKGDTGKVTYQDGCEFVRVTATHIQSYDGGLKFTTENGVVYWVSAPFTVEYTKN